MPNCSRIAVSFAPAYLHGVRNGNQFYGSFTRCGRRTLRVTMTNHPVNGSHPDQRVYYAEIHLLTGDMTRSDGTVIGNVFDDSPAPMMADLETVATPVDGKRTWVYDVGDADDPEIVWSSFVASDIAGTSRYHYTRRVAGQWRTTDLASAGKAWAAPAEPYLGGVQLPTGGPGGVVYLSRNVGDDWYVERHSSHDDGVTFDDVALLGALGRPLVRAWPVEHLDATVSYEALAQDITYWSSYGHHTSTIVGLGRSAGAPALRLRRDGVDHAVSHLRRDGTDYILGGLRQIT